MEESRIRHHFVSEFYLRGFANDRARPVLYVVARDGRAFVTGTRAIAVENNFHTIETDAGDSDVVEKAFADFEGQVSAALARILERQYLGDDDDASLLLFFATLLIIKHPAVRAQTNSATDKMTQMVIRARAGDARAFARHIEEMKAATDMPEDTDPEVLRQAILSGDYEVALSRNAHLAAEFQNARDLYPLVAGRGWNLVMAGGGHFITSDRPAVLTWKNPRESRPTGIGLPGTRILFPLSPVMALIGGFELQTTVFEIDRGDVAKFNGRIILEAHRQVYARDEQFEYHLQPDERPRLGSTLRGDKRFTGSSFES